MANGWDIAHDELQALIREIREVAPDAATADEGEAYVARVLTTFLNDSFLAHVLVQDGLSRVLPTRGAPNPDYIMQHAQLDSEKSYQLAGCLNDSERVGVGLFRYGNGGSVEIAEYVSIDGSKVDDSGNFLIDIGAGAEGTNALPLAPDTCFLLVRTLHRDLTGVPARLRLLGAPAPDDLTLASGGTAATLSRAAQMTTASVRQFLSWSEQASAYPNQFRGDGEIEGLAQTIQGDPDTEYFLGYFELSDGEALQVTMQPGIDGYWSVHAYNHWCEYLPGASAHDMNTRTGSDGTTTITIAPQFAASAANPIDTKGRKKGVLVCRVIGGSLPGPPEATVLKPSCS